MSKYHSLDIFKYENPTANIQNEYKKRIESPATLKTDLSINPIEDGNRSSEEYNLFLVNIPELSTKQSIIQSNSNKVIGLINSLPKLASDQLFYNTLSSEIKSTNDIEDVKTTDKEISEAISNAQNNKNKKSRLYSFAKMYLQIKDGKYEKIEDPNDIRKLYDFLLKGEIPNNKLPEGNIFRDRYVRIGNDTKTVHLPKEHEKDFMSDINKWIKFINVDSDEISFLIKAFISHYFFEYIHPFNDGNGRLGRYILCVYLGHKLDYLSAITFSSQINKNKSKYYKAFSNVENKRNFGEITFFVKSMMDILIKGQHNLIKELVRKLNILNLFGEHLDNIFNDELKKHILYMYIQSFLFNSFGNGIEDRVIKDFLKKNDSKLYKTHTQSVIDEWENKKIIIKTNGSPKKHVLSENYFNNMLDEMTENNE